VCENGVRYKDVIQITADHENNYILAVVPKEYLKEGNPKDWKYTVLVFSHDGYSLGCVREVALREEVWRGGGADNLAYVQPIDGKLGVSPNVYDVLAETVEEQVRMLSSYRLSEDPKKAAYAKVYGVGVTKTRLPGVPLVIVAIFVAVLTFLLMTRK
jgi:carbohydrate-binding DOMON domain-containing protein